MGFANALRRVLSPLPPSPPRRARRPHHALQERAVIASYRSHLTHLSDQLARGWRVFDAEPDDYAVVHQLRDVRARLTTALDSYYAALGARDPAGVEHVLARMEAADVRLANLHHEVLAEVDRFEHAALDIAARFASAVHPTHRAHVCADANDILIELELYRHTWASVMDPLARGRLEHATAVLREVVYATPPAPAPVPAVWASPAPAPRLPRRAAPAATAPAVAAGAGAPTAAAPPPAAAPAPPPRSARKRRSRSQSVVPAPPPAAESLAAARLNSTSAKSQPDTREYGSSESGDDGPMRMVMSRTRTLRDVAETVMRLQEQDARCEPPPAPLPNSPRASADNRPAPSGPAVEQPNLAKAKNASFASTLYQTRHARVDAISDAGLELRRSNVRGDGRCMFRALARCRVVAPGNPIPSERVEREEADMLRLRAVQELKKHRDLLARFFVIEGNFAQYTRKMSHPRTYGGEPELLMLAKLLHVPIAVYIQKSGAYRQIQVYGKQYRGDPLRILYSDGVHYDALLASAIS